MELRRCCAEDMAMELFSKYCPTGQRTAKLGQYILRIENCRSGYGGICCLTKTTEAILDRGDGYPFVI